MTTHAEVLQRLYCFRRSTYTDSRLVGEQNYSSFTTQPLTAKGNFITGAENPNWKEKVARGLDASSNYDRRIVEYKQNPLWSASGSGTAKVLGQQVFRTSSARESVQWDPTKFCDDTQNDATTQDIALGRLKKRMDGRSNQVNLMIPLVEIRELRDTVKAIAYAGVDVLKALIDIKRTKGSSAYKYASHAWLTFSFGIAPTISDANAIIKSIDSFMTDRNEAMYREHGSATKVWVDQVVASSNEPFLSDCNSRMLCVRAHRLSYRYTCGFVPGLKSGNDYTMEDHFGLNFGSMVPAAWELTPFSWVFDYFGTIGPLLEDVFQSNKDSVRFLTLNRKYVCEMDFVYDLKPQTDFMQIFNLHKSRPQRSKVTRFSRTKLATIPTRALRFRTPDEITGVDGMKAVKRCLNLASVLVGGKAFSNRID